MAEEKKRPVIETKLRHNILAVPEEARKASGIVIFGRRIKTLVFTTDLAIIRNCNADAVFAVYPFTPQTAIGDAIIKYSYIPVFAGVGGGTTHGVRTIGLAKDMESSGAMGIVLNSPIKNVNLLAVSKAVDIPVVITVTSIDTDIKARLEAGASILISQSDYKYDGGKPIEPEISVSFNSEAMTADKDYTVAYSNNTNAGKGTVTITGKGIYKGTLSEEFTIGKAPVEIWFETAAGAEATELETTFGTTFTEPVLKLNPADAIEVTYSVNDENVATIDPSTGKLTILKGGTVVVTAAAKEDYTNKEGSNYKADPSNTKASYSLTINKTTPPTGITFVNSDKQAVMSGWYTIDGQKIAEPTQKGLYIKDGKKIVIR